MDSSDQSNQETNHSIESETIIPSDNGTSEEATKTTESEEMDLPTAHVKEEISENDTTNMIHGETTFPDGTSADLSLGTSHSSVARILVKPGQIFRVQVDNEVKEVHGKFIAIDCVSLLTREKK